MRTFLKKDGYLYGVLFSGTAFIVVAMLIIEANMANGEKTNFLSTKNNTADSLTSDVISNLLLANGDLTIEEKTSLINLYLKGGEPVTGGATASINQKREEVYNAIFRRQMSRARQSAARTTTANSGFSVKPVPK